MNRPCSKSLALIRITSVGSVSSMLKKAARTDCDPNRDNAATPANARLKRLIGLLLTKRCVTPVSPGPAQAQRKKAPTRTRVRPVAGKRHRPLIGGAFTSIAADEAVK